MTQTLVQMNAPEASRGRVLGLFNMAAAGLRTFSGVTVGLLGSVATVHASLALAAMSFIGIASLLLALVRTLERSERADWNADCPSSRRI